MGEFRSLLVGRAGVYFPEAGAEAAQRVLGLCFCIKGAGFCLDVSWAVLRLTAGIDFRWRILGLKARQRLRAIYFAGGSALKACVIHAVPLSYSHFCVSNVPIPADLMELASAAPLSRQTDIFYIYQLYLQAPGRSIIPVDGRF